MGRVRNSLRVFGCALALGLAAQACSPSVPADAVIGPLRRLVTSEQPPKLHATSAERFGGSMGAPRNTGSFKFTAPEGWKARPPSGMRALDFQVGDGAGDECTVTVLAGDAGGALANVNRWCGQIGVANWTQEQLDAAPAIPMLGAQGVVVLLEGDSAPRAVLGAMVRHGERSVFVKLTASRAVARAQRTAFEDFCKSLAKEP